MSKIYCAVPIWKLLIVVFANIRIKSIFVMASYAVFLKMEIILCVRYCWTVGVFFFSSNSVNYLVGYRAMMVAVYFGISC